jgi:hypothetical protein
MQSITDKIIAALTLKLTTNAPSGVTVARSRRRPAELTELPLITVRPLKEHVQKATVNPRCPAVLRVLNVAVTVRCAGEDADLDTLRTYAIEQVMSDLSIGGFAAEVEEVEHDWDGDGAATDADYAEDTIVFSVKYQTARGTAVSK